MIQAISVKQEDKWATIDTIMRFSINLFIDDTVYTGLFVTYKCSRHHYKEISGWRIHTLKSIYDARILSHC